MKIAVLFDGAGLARLGLEEAGHTCTGFELNPWKVYLGNMVGSGNVIEANALEVDLSSFDAVWASPPCQSISVARSQPKNDGLFKGDFLSWCLSLPHEVLWVENIVQNRAANNTWGTYYNAHQFLEVPIQNRQRIVGGRFIPPQVYRPFTNSYPNICPAITATEHKWYPRDPRRASRFYGRMMTIEEAAYHQGFKIPDGWHKVGGFYSPARWRNLIFEAIGNGVPTYMAKAFGDRYQ